MTIGQKIRDFRIAKQWSQAELSFRAGTHAATLSKIESGKTKPRSFTLKHLSMALSIPLSEFTEHEKRVVRVVKENTTKCEAIHARLVKLGYCLPTKTKFEPHQ